MRFLAGALCAAMVLATTVRAQTVGPRSDRKIDESRVTYFVSPTGSDASDGRTRAKAFASMQKAADTVKPGDTVLVTKGVYKEGFHIRTEGREDAWITFVAEPGAEIRGSDVRGDWTREPGETPIYSIPRPKLHGNYQKPEATLQQRTEQVFVDGVLLRQVPERAMLKPKGVFYVDDAAEKLYVSLDGGKDPNAQRTEVTARTWAIAIGGPPNMNVLRDEKIIEANKAAYVRIVGFTIRNIGNFSRMGAIQVRGKAHHITIEDCDVQWANYSGIAIGGPFHTVRHCITSNCGAQGIGGGGTTDAVIEYNLIDNNNYKGISPWSEGGAVKVGFTGERIVIRGNVARNNDNHGLWIDYGATDSLIENNLVVNAMAGAILNEVTPAPPPTQDDPNKHLELTGDEVRKLSLKGTIIRNNILVGTRPPGGGGINVSNAVATDLYNNIVYGNTGGGINFGGSPNRAGTLGLWGNRAHSNLFDQNFRHAESSRDAEDKKGRYFNNVFESNLFLRARSASPFRISGAEAGRDEWEALNEGKDNVYADRALFRDPEKLDFTLLDESLARQVGFDPGALRLDWSEFYIPVQTKTRRVEARDFTPIDLSSLFNRGLIDDVAGDGKGGWTDHGGNDMSRFPTGRQTLDGVVFQLGTQDRGALLLDNPFVKPGGFPAEVTVPIGGKRFDELNFLYASAWTSDTRTENGQKIRIPVPEVARFVIRYTDGTQVAVPVVVKRHILDWWNDASWQEYAALNDNGVYVAWQGPNRVAGRVTAYYMRWTNPEPDKPIASVVVGNKGATSPAAFFLLGLTGANRKSGGGPRVFHLGFDGDVDALGSADEEITAAGFTPAAFDAGTFVDGIRGRAFIPKKPIYYAPPADFPLGGQGTLSIWLKADDWATPERQAGNRNTDYTRTMTPFSSAGATPRHAPWGVSFEIAKADLKTLTMSASTGGGGERVDITSMIKPNEWFNVTTTWQPRSGKPGTVRRVFLNGRQVSVKETDDRPDVVGASLYVGVPSNGGQPWRGAMDELTLWNRAFTEKEVADYVASFTAPLGKAAR